VSYLARLGLGTAQWGLEYGVANATGRPSAAAVAEMLDLGWSAGIGLLGHGECVRRRGKRYSAMPTPISASG
jgi:hypothetical protein